MCSLCATLRRHASRYSLNWEKAPATVDLSVAVPPGKYLVFARGIDRWYRVVLNGNTTLTAQDLANFRVQLPAEQPCVFYIASLRAG